MAKLILLFNHTLTPAQEADTRNTLLVETIVEPPSDIKFLWAQVPPEPDGIVEYLAPILTWLRSVASVGDLALIQGEFGATWLAVQEAFHLGLIPLYSTTRRKAVEEHLSSGDVAMQHIFSHVRFRRYNV